MVRVLKEVHQQVWPDWGVRFCRLVEVVQEVGRHAWALLNVYEFALVDLELLVEVSMAKWGKAVE